LFSSSKIDLQPSLTSSLNVFFTSSNNTRHSGQLLFVK
jgi:hypothetical protein